MVCHVDDGTQAPTALGTRRRFAKFWVQPYGLPELIVVDQGPEFTGHEFREFWKQHGVLVHFTDSKSPWQNGPTERAGGIFKEILDKMVADLCITTEEEFLDIVPIAVAQRNARMSNCGFSPDQRCFGKSLRLPGHMLTEGDKIDPDLMNLSADDAMRRMWDIQDCAARACVTRRSKDQVVKALQESRRRFRFEDEVEPGTWVMVWRKPDMGPGNWTGPGLLVANNKKGSTCYVDMAGRFWKCSRELWLV